MVPCLGSNSVVVQCLGSNSVVVPCLGSNSVVVPCLGSNSVVVPCLGSNSVVVPCLGSNSVVVPCLGSNSVVAPPRSPQIETIVGKFGLVVITREGSNPYKFIYESDTLSRLQVGTGGYLVLGVSVGYFVCLYCYVKCNHYWISFLNGHAKIGTKVIAL